MTRFREALIKDKYIIVKKNIEKSLASIQNKLNKIDKGEIEWPTIGSLNYVDSSLIEVDKLLNLK